MAIKITRRQRDKYGNVWLRDNYGGWTNEYGIRFTKKEHRMFGYAVREANKAIAKYQAKFPMPRELKARGTGSRYRSGDLSRFRRKVSYRKYLRVTRRIASGEQLYQREPNQYRNNLIKALENAKKDLRNAGASNDQLINLVIARLKKLTGEEIINLARSPFTPDINIYYVNVWDITISNISRLYDLIKGE